MKKRIISLLAWILCLSVSLSLFACNNETQDGESETATEEVTDGTTESESDTENVTESETSTQAPAEKTVSFDVTTITLNKGESVSFTAKVTPSDANPTWTSSAPTVAIYENGEIKALDVGSAVITATLDNGSSASCTVTVIDDENNVSVSGVSLNKVRVTLNVGESEPLAASVSPADATNKALTWTSSDTDVATVVDGVVYAVGEGTASITAISVNGIFATCTVTVVIPAEIVEVESIVLNKTSMKLNVEESDYIIATIAPENATNKSLVWTSSDESVATVYNGMVTAIGEGSATITVACSNGVSATCSVTVSVPEVVVPVESVIINRDSLTLNVDESYTLVATVAPENATNRTVSWTSSAPSVVNVYNGVLEAISEGVAVITATSSNGNVAVCMVTVVKPAVDVPVSGITLDYSKLSMEIDSTATIVATVAPENATNRTVSWTSSNPDIVRVAGGVLEAVGEGKAVIAATTSNGKVAMCEVTVVRPEEVIAVESVTLNRDTLDLNVDESYTLIATVTPDDATNRTVSWTSSDRSVATVYNGVVEAIGEGVAAITVSTANGKIAVCMVTVSKPKAEVPVQGIALDRTELSMLIDSSATLTATVTPENATNRNVSWTSSDSSVVTVSGGVLQAVGEGIAAITATSSNGKVAVCMVTVTKPAPDVPVESITLDCTELSMEQGSNKTLNAALSPDDATNKTVYWTTSDPSVVKVSNGVLEAIGEGIAAITATSSNGKVAVCMVTVIKSVGSVSLDKTALSLDVGAVETVIATVVPADATDPTIIWTTTDASVATVQNGVITAVGKGTATIVATSSNGKSASCNVNVSVPVVKVTGITLDKSKLELFVNQEAFLIPSIAPINATDLGVIWSSSDPETVSVTDGKIRGLKAGNATVSVKTVDGEFVASCEVTVQNGSIIYELTDDFSFYVVTGYTGYEKNVEIPYIYNGLRVRAIGKNAFKNATHIESVTIPNSVVMIDEYAFYGCTSLRSVSFPDSVKSIGRFAFMKCTSLASAEILGSDVLILNDAFNSCLSLERVKLDGSIKEVGARAFDSCISLSSFTFTPGITRIDEAAFRDCIKLESVVLQDGLTTIGQCAFDNCFKLEKIELPDSVTSVGAMAFRHAESLASVKFSANMTKIENATFQYCISLETVELHEKIVDIGESAFSYCDILSDLTIMGQIKEFGSSAFYECRHLENIYFNSATKDCASNNIYIFYNAGIDGDGITLTLSPTAYIPEGIFEPIEKSNAPKLTTLIVEDGAVAVDYFAEKNYLPYLSTITLPDTIAQINYGIFNNSLWWTMQKGGLVYINNVLYGYVDKSAPESVTVRDDTVCIATGAFKDANTIGSLTIPYLGKTALDENNFYLGYLYGAENAAEQGEYVSGALKHIEIKSIKTEIPENTFYGCEYLEGVVIPDTVVTIGESAFYGCSSLKEIKLSGDLVKIKPSAFFGCSNVTSLSIPEKVREIGFDAFSGMSSLAEITVSDKNDIYHSSGSESIIHTKDKILVLGCKNTVIPEDGSVSSIASHAFHSAYGLTSITVPDAVTVINSGAFHGCKALRSMALPFIGKNISANNPFGFIFGSDEYEGGTVANGFCVPDSLTNVIVRTGKLSTGAFKECASISSISLPYDITSLPESAFEGCVSLSDITIPESVTIIYAKAFKDCSALKNMIVPTYVNRIYDDVFRGCSSLVSIEIPDSVTSIGNTAFADCSSLVSIDIPDSVTSIGDTILAGCSSLEELIIPEIMTGVRYFYTLDGFAYSGGVLSSTNTEDYSLGKATIVANEDHTFRIEYRVSSEEGYDYLIIEKNGEELVKISGKTAKEVINVDLESGDTLTFKYSKDASKAINDDKAYITISLQEKYNTKTPDVLGSLFGREEYTNGQAVMQNGTAYYIPKSLNSVSITKQSRIADGAFMNCAFVENITIPDAVTAIGDRAFYGCSTLSSIVIPNTVTSIGNSVFYGNNSIESITLPFIGDGTNTHFGAVFGARDCLDNGNYVPASLRTVVITGGASVDDYAFFNCSSIESISLPDSMTSIGEYAFFGCSALESYDIPSALTSMGDYAFNGCESLKYINVPDAVTSIGNNTFEGCTSLEYVKLPFVGSGADDNTYFGYVFGADSYSNNAYCVPNTLKTVVITGGTEIDRNAFYGCSFIESITIPDSVTYVGADAFGNCSSLSYCEDEYAMYLGSETNPYLVLVGFKDTSVTSYEINAQTKVIAEQAFRGCGALESVTIPDSVITIGDYAFYGCSSLVSLEIPDSVTNMGYAILNGCTSLESVTVPFLGDGSAEHTNFGYIFGASDYSVNGSYVPTSLKNVILAGVESIDRYAFYNCTSIESITIPDSVTSIGESAFSHCTSLKNATVPDSVTSIGIGAFEYCSSLESVTLPFMGDGTTNNTHFGYVFGASDYSANSSYVPYSLKSVEIKSGTSIDRYAFYDCFNIESIDIPDTVTSIGDYAFYNCASLVSMDIPEGVTSIGEYAFGDCTSIRTIDVPDSVTSIGIGAFENCSSVESITLPFVGDGTGANTYFGYVFGASYYGDNSGYVPYSLKNVEITGGTSVDNNAFYGCSNIESIDIPDAVTSIGDYAFYDCASLVSMDIPEGVTSIGEYAFGGCTSIRTIDIPDSVTSIGIGAFENCSSVESITLPFVGDGTGANTYFGYVFGASYHGDNPNYVPYSLKNVEITGGTEIADNAFYNCTGIVNVTLPEGITSIGNSAFAYSYEIESVNIPNSVTSIEDSAFYACSSLESVTIPYGVTHIGNSAFGECSSLEQISIPETATSIGNGAFDGCVSSAYTEDGYARYVGNESNPYLVLVKIINTDITSYEINSQTKIIAEYAFAYCSYLESVMIPDGVISIGAHAFYGCYTLTTINIPSGVTSIGEYAFYGCSSLTTINIPSGVTSIGDHTFYNCSSLGTINIQSGVTSIGEYAFYGCSSLTTINIPSGVTSIGRYALYDCSSLSTISIPNSVTSIGEYAFGGCSSLSTISIPNSVTSIGEYAFYNCSSLESITLPFVGGGTNGYTNFGYIFGASSYSYNSSYVPSSLKTVEITGGTSVASYAFYNCYYIESITLPNGVTSIGEYAFYDCYALTTINIPSGVTSIGEYAFYGCSSLTTINIPSGVTSIGDHTFYNCSSLGTINIQSGATSIGRYAFYGCSSLSTISIPNSVTSIGDHTFYNCSSLTTIDIPNSVTSIGQYALYGCSSLESITLPFVGGGTNGYTNFGYIFGASSYSYNSSYVPSSLKTVEITGGTSVASYAFYNCYYIESITLPNGVTSIGEYAFSDCDALTTINIPSGVTSIGDRTFYNCSSLTTIDIPNSVTSIGQYAFCNCSSLSAISIPNSVTSIGQYALYGCSSLSTISIPNSVTSIGDHTFYNCSSLTTIDIPHSVTSIGQYAFYGCSSLESITLPFVGGGTNGYTNFGYIFGASSYSYNSSYVPSSLKTVEITGGTSVASYAFYNCKNIESVTLPNSVTSIGDNVFYGCSSLEKLTIPKNLGEYSAVYNTDYTRTYSSFSLSNGVWTSTNKSHGSSSYLTITAKKDMVITFRYRVSSEANYDKLTITHNDTRLAQISGTTSSSYTTKTVTLFAGDTLKFVYSKDGSQSSGSDCGYVIFDSMIVVDQTIGALFGTSSYSNSYAAVQNGYTYYLPSSLTSVTLSNATRIGNDAFANCTGIQEVIIPSGATVSSSAFTNCPATVTKQ